MSDTVGIDKTDKIDALLQEADRFSPSKGFLAATQVADPDAHYARKAQELGLDPGDVSTIEE
jgi:hypothetical protein